METNSSGGGSSSGSLGSSSTMILHNAVIVTMDKESRVFRNGGVFVVQDRIKAIGQSADILQQFSQMADQIIDLQSQILLPGHYSHTHTHARARTYNTINLQVTNYLLRQNVYELLFYLPTDVATTHLTQNMYHLPHQRSPI